MTTDHTQGHPGTYDPVGEEALRGMWDRKPLIQVQRLRKCFDEIEVLKDISVDIHKGDVVCVIGPSGSGKSTFLRCLNRLEEPTDGKIFLRALISRTQKLTLTCTARRWAWCSSSLTCFLT